MRGDPLQQGARRHLGGETCGHFGGVIGRGSGRLGVSPGRDRTGDPIARGQVLDSLAHGTHYATDLRSRDMGERRGVAAVSQIDIAEVDPHRVHVDKHLGGTRCRIGPFDEREDLWSAGHGYLDGAHAIQYSAVVGP
ncbi:Uncharacterised protein [Mycobacteroides abscessus subsp. abscessus]|nr:Uncharacterised protein [Mycobacteroides abscessus subsp. abscessus]SLC93768.1 Uncharacterised protein [Mycobacteroides abscessus subsp. massiliense]